MCHPSTVDGAFISSLAVHMFEAEFFGKAAHAVQIPLNNVDSRLLRHGKELMPSMV